MSKYRTVAVIMTILISLVGCAQTRALNKLEELILDDNEYVHSQSKSRIICCIESIDYERKHEEIINIIFNNGNLDLIDEFVEYFPDDYRNYIIRGDAYLKNAMMQQMIGVFMKSSAAASVNTAKESYMKALELNNRDIYALGVLSFLYGEEKEYDQAEKLLNRGLGFAPNNPLLYLALGEMYDRKKEYNTAIDYYERVLKFTEDEVEKDFEHMNQYYHKLIDYFPDSLAKAKEEARKIIEKLKVK
ncbi:MAG: tetratricopeptide repeat protein [Candidatus Scalindua rubra]|uniref:Tetratricopeptide repeat protein n=1 Tax=Candidatus Scalindua brodae TaxID=237368 RepID=A0A0B0EKK2_9BACT|nr:MAG: Tetratricopeptide repeat protein [Candidatus Scalindua brodae]MBZ0109688.1 tetratricopeptide repeat protein [Candidatus Scalindua rubra]